MLNITKIIYAGDLGMKYEDHKMRNGLHGLLFATKQRTTNSIVFKCTFDFNGGDRECVYAPNWFRSAFERVSALVTNVLGDP